MARGKKNGNGNGAPITTGQRLGSLLKSCRDTMRKDKGLNGDLDRLPQLTWLLFLKFLDDLEQQDEVKATLGAEAYFPLIPAPYRWRDWAVQADGITGDELLAFINNDEALLPNGRRGPGLFAKLRGLQGAEGGDRRDVISRVFSGLSNRMINGYLIRDVITKINEIHFSSSEEIHTLSGLYEGLLREMRDAAGDSGEFYTVRPVVKLMVTVTDPKLGEVVLDPACGTGGFLVETFEHLKGQVKTTQDRDRLQRRTLFGGEAKSLPLLLCEMNMLLHGVEVPNIASGNSLAVKLTEIGDKDRVDVILTNPPFGGEEEDAIKGGFPRDMQTSETALLFLQLIMRKLRRTPRPGRAAVVVPNGTLSGDSVCARIKEQLLKEFNLHTIVRLPNGVFAPYTPIPTNLLFFDRTGPTKEVWYYEHPVPEDRKTYTKTKPLRYEEFEPLLAWWPRRQESDCTWKVGAADVLKYDQAGNLLSCNLDIKNPRTAADVEGRSPQELVQSILDKERQILGLMEEVAVVLGGPA